MVAHGDGKFGSKRYNNILADLEIKRMGEIGVV